MHGNPVDGNRINPRAKESLEQFFLPNDKKSHRESEPGAIRGSANGRFIQDLVNLEPGSFWQS